MPSVATTTAGPERPRLASSLSAHGSKPAPLYTNTRAFSSRATSWGAGSQSCGSTPGGTMEMTSAWSPPTWRANSYSG